MGSKKKYEFLDEFKNMDLLQQNTALFILLGNLDVVINKPGRIAKEDVLKAINFAQEVAKR